MSVTMRDVAQKAGVSIKTVSRVVNDQGEISEATRQRVLAVIEEMDYRPNLIARGLVTQRTYTVGLVVGDITNPFFPEVARGVQDIARTRDYHVLLCNSDEDLREELHILRTLAAQGVDGIIAFTSYQSKNNLSIFTQQYRPLVVVNYYFEHPNVSLIMVDNHQGAKLAVDYLVGQGHTAIGMLAGLEVFPDKVRRVQGFQTALELNGLPIINGHIVPGSPTLERGYESTLQLLTQHPQITAIFAYNDLLALGAIQACNQLGRAIPEDCAIVGFDDIRLASMVTPKLTTIRTDKYDLGQQAMTRLLAMMDNPEAIFSPIFLDVELVVRETA